MDDRRMLVELSRAEALRLLGTAPIGRVVFTHRALPAIRPVNHVVVDESVIVRTSIGSTVASITGGQLTTVVAYEADAIDPDTRTGWSVVVTGVARLIRDPAETRQYEKLLRPWVDNDIDTVLEIRSDIVTGFRLVPASDGAAVSVITGPGSGWVAGAQRGTNDPVR